MEDSIIKENLRKFITDNFVRDKRAIAFSDDDSFFEKELIDSTGVLELVLFIEQFFNLRIEDDEITPENLDSIDNLVMYIKSKPTISQ